MKKCNKCNQEKEVTQYHKNNRTPDGYSRRCKECEKEYLRERQKKGDGYWSVYYLPKEDYYGHTHNVKSRMRSHRNNGKDTTGYKILKTSNTKPDVLFYEKLNQGKLKPLTQRKLITVYRYNQVVCLAKTLRAAGEKAGVTQERVRQLINSDIPTSNGYYFYK